MQKIVSFHFKTMIHAYIYTYILTYYMRVHGYIHAYMHASIYTYTEIYIHSCIHTCTYTHSGGSRGGKSGHGPHRSWQWSLAPLRGADRLMIALLICGNARILAPRYRCRLRIWPPNGKIPH